MTYLWRDIDPAFWQRVKVKAKAQDLNLRELMQQIVERWLAE